MAPVGFSYAPFLTFLPTPLSQKKSLKALTRSSWWKSFVFVFFLYIGGKTKNACTQPRWNGGPRLSASPLGKRSSGALPPVGGAQRSQVAVGGPTRCWGGGGGDCAPASVSKKQVGDKAGGVRVKSKCFLLYRRLPRWACGYKDAGSYSSIKGEVGFVLSFFFLLSIMSWEWSDPSKLVVMKSNVFQCDFNRRVSRFTFSFSLTNPTRVENRRGRKKASILEWENVSSPKHHCLFGKEI